MKVLPFMGFGKPNFAKSQVAEKKTQPTNTTPPENTFQQDRG